MVEEGSAEIARGSVARPIEKLHHQRPVEAIIPGNDRDIGRAGVRAGDGRGQIAGKTRQGKLTTRTVRHSRTASHSLRKMNDRIVDNYDSEPITARRCRTNWNGDS